MEVRAQKYIPRKENLYKMKMMFICTGNICRSAMAEAIVEEKTKESGDDDIEVCSAGTNAEDGALPIKETVEVMKERGIDIKNHKATNIKHSHIKEMDLILCAANEHKKYAIQMYPQLKNKVYTIKEYALNQNIDIPDPYGGTRDIYEKCADDIMECCEIIIDKIRGNRFIGKAI